MIDFDQAATGWVSVNAIDIGKVYVIDTAAFGIAINQIDRRATNTLNRRKF